MKTYIIKLQNPFRHADDKFTTNIYAVKDPVAPYMYSYTYELHSATRFSGRGEMRKTMNHVATQFIHHLGYVRSTNPKAITVNE